MSNWQLIDTAPRDGTRVLVSLWAWADPDSGVRLCECAHFFGDRWYSGYTDDLHKTGDGIWPPTHWQPLPEPPAP